MSRRMLATLTVSGMLLVTAAAGAAGLTAGLPAGQLDPSVPTPEKTLGFALGEEITTPEQIAACARALAAAAPTRVRLEEYGRSVQGRPLLLLTVSSEANLARLDAIRQQLAGLGDPRRTTAEQAAELAAELPATVWLGGSVHGDETSGADALLALAQLLVAGGSPEVAAIRDHVVVAMDLVQNPDGRARFVASTRAARGLVPDPEPDSAEHTQPWPGGRVSQRLFDLNRDWFALTQPETAARVAMMLEVLPQVAVDLHEMGASDGYYFPPAAPPHHPLLGKTQKQLWKLLAAGTAHAFDERGWRYWTREIFDAFYPGYGEGWPYFNGAVGATYEQASARGLVIDPGDEESFTYHDAVSHHLVAAFATCATVAGGAPRFLTAWYDYRRQAVQEAGRSAPAGFVLRCPADPARAGELAALLARQGIETHAVAGEPDAWLVPLGQPLGRLALTLLAADTPMDEAFIAEQERRIAKDLPSEIFDITAWSLPLLWGVTATPVSKLPATQDVTAAPPWRPEPGTPVAFLAPWTGLDSARTLASLLRHDVVVRGSAKDFTAYGRHFGRGSLVVRTAENHPGLEAALEQAAAAGGIQLTAATSGLSEDGVDLGSTAVRRVPPPSIALAWDEPTEPSSTGHLRYALERTIGYPVTAVRTADLADAALERFDVIILPDADDGDAYGTRLGDVGVERLGNWVSEGGVLVAVGAAAAWLTTPDVGLLASSLVTAKPEPASATEPAMGRGGAHPGEDGGAEAAPGPPAVPGAILTARLDPDHWLGAGFPSGTAHLMALSSRVFAAPPQEKATTVARWAPADELLAAGFLFPESRELLPGAAAVIAQPSGRGLVIAFAEDPAFRGLTREATLLLANAVFFGPVFH